jgi:hypothetical protein
MIFDNLNRHPLRRELSLVLVIKLVLLFLLWLVFFRTPPQTNPQAMGDTLFSTPANVLHAR